MVDHSTLPYAKALVSLRLVDPAEKVVSVRLAGERAHRTLVGFMRVVPSVKEQAYHAGFAWPLAEAERLIDLCRDGERKKNVLKYHLRKGDLIRIKCDKQIAASWYGPGAEEKIE